jgi:hypothetical protein
MNAYTIMDNTQDGWKSEDCSDFVFGIPCSVDNTFQQGQTSQSIVAYTFEADVLTSSPFYNSTCVPEFATLSDGVFAIQVIPGGGVVCRIKELDISTPAE